MKNSKRLLTLLLAVVMLVSMFTIAANAQDLIVPVDDAIVPNDEAIAPPKDETITPPKDESIAPPKQDDTIAPPKQDVKITINYNTSRVPALGTILPHTLTEGGSFTLPGSSIKNLCWSLGNDVFEAGEYFTYENMVKISSGSVANFTFVAFIDEPITDNPPVYGEEKDPPVKPEKPGKPDHPGKPEKPGQKPGNGFYKVTVQAYVTGYLNNSSCGIHKNCDGRYNNCDVRYYSCGVHKNCNGGRYDCEPHYSYCDVCTKDNKAVTYSNIYNKYQSTKCNKCGNYYGYVTAGKVDAFGSGSYKAGQRVTVSAKGAAGYTFVGWRSSSNVRFANSRAMSTTFIMPAGNVEVYAVFTANGSYSTCNSYHTHTIRYTDGVSNEVVFNDVVKTVRHGAATPTIKDPVRPGYRFVGWSPKVSKTATECVTYVAQWSNGVAPQLTTEHVAYLKGYGKGMFRPDNKMTRAEFAVLLYRLLDQKTVQAYYNSANSFSDVAADAWYNEAVSTLANAGVISGTTFRPTEYISRAEMVAMLAAFYTTDYSCSYTCKYKDVPTNYWAYDEIAMAQNLGWIKGYGANTFLPEATITRAEVAAIMNRVLGRTNCGTIDTKNYKDNPVSAWFYQDVVEATIAH